jgi:hypothetical protein
LLRSCQLNYIGREEMARHKSEENSPKDNILLSVVVAPKANENAILQVGQEQDLDTIDSGSRTFMKFSTISRRFMTTIKWSDQWLLVELVGRGHKHTHPAR